MLICVFKVVFECFALYLMLTVTNLGARHPRGCRTPVGYEVRDAGGPRPIDLLYFSLCFNGGQHEEELNRGRTCNFYPKL